ncbi:hypothetical protein [Pseudomonas lactis]|uniref:hypothetical protein n=1 Tax=Pseudomonas lactis TaxID=1615674 RepID=UPI00110C88F1|nr:hypothetical protein [Pseudomonas lactis]MBK3446026.1 hypothetical protein [Pseudomonas lactis]
MKPEHAEQLQTLVAVPHLSPRSRLLVLRRMARESHARWEAVQVFFDSEIKGAKAGFPSAAKALKKIRGLYKQAQVEHQQIACVVGRWLFENDALLTTMYGFEGICELLEVNPVHRAEVVQYAGDMDRAIFAIAFESGLEESASRQSGRHPADWKDGALHQALWKTREQMGADTR